LSRNGLRINLRSCLFDRNSKLATLNLIMRVPGPDSESMFFKLVETCSKCPKSRIATVFWRLAEKLMFLLLGCFH
jgi:hypothetical protein